MDCDEALLRLKAGNARFARGSSLHPHEAQDWRRHLAHGHQPFATVLGCSDPTAPPEIIFDQGLGDLFVIRVAGNVVTPDVLGSVQFAGAHLGTRLFVVLGHEGCGTVRAALAEHAGTARQAGRIASVVRQVMPALRELPTNDDDAQQLADAVEANVRWAMSLLATMPEAHKALAEHRVRIVGGIYTVQSGMVRFLE